MCLVAFALDVAEFVLVVAANRDEFHGRPTAPAAFWNDVPRVFAGRDLDKGGTWLAFSRDGRFSAVTNVRSWPPAPGPKSRGALCADFARGEMDALAYANGVFAERHEFAAFNLLVHDGRSMLYVGKSIDPVSVEPGIHALSNASLDVPWPKVERATLALRAALAGPRDALSSSLFTMLADRTKADDHALPTTGVPLEIERDLAPIFISAPAYGTRSSTVVLWRRDGRAQFEERSFGPNGVAMGAIRVELDVPIA